MPERREICGDRQALGLYAWRDRAEMGNVGRHGYRKRWARKEKDELGSI